MLQGRPGTRCSSYDEEAAPSSSPIRKLRSTIFPIRVHWRSLAVHSLPFEFRALNFVLPLFLFISNFVL